MLHIRITLLSIAVTITGCKSTKVSGPVLQPVGITAPPNDAAVNSVEAWVLTTSRQPHTYRSISQTTVYELSSSVTHQSTIEVITAFTISVDQSHTPLIISGHIDTVTFSPQNQLPPDTKPLSLPLLFEGQFAPPVLTITVKNPQRMDGSCNSLISSILSDLRTVVATYPIRLTPSSTWRDSTLITTCTTGGIPTTRKTIQSFRVVGERAFNTTRALLLQRLDSTYISGDGAEGNHQIHLEGSGVGTANLYISPTIAAIVGLELSENLRIAITNSGKTRHFIQEVTQRLKTIN